MVASSGRSESRPINLLKGWPAQSLLPAGAISRAAQAVLSDKFAAHPALLYGPDEGHEPLREALAAWLERFYKPEHVLTKDRIAITGGASQNLGCMLQVFTDPLFTRNVWIVAPAYMLAFRIFEDNGFAGKLRAVPEDDEGVDVNFLRRELLRNEKQIVSQGEPLTTLKPARAYSKYYRHIIYCVPTFANPSSCTMTLDRRRDLVRCAREFDALIIADDVYDHLQWPAQPIVGASATLAKACMPRLVDIDATLDGGPQDEFGNAISNGSFSKICGPGLRVGWVDASPKFTYGVSQTGTTRSGGAPSQLTSTYMAQLLQTGFFDEHIFKTLQPAYARRYKTLTEAIKEYLLPLGATLPQSKRTVVGGYFVWLKLPSSIRAEVLVQRCKDEEDVIVAGGRLFGVPGDENVAFEHCIRLCFSWEDEDKLSEGVKRVAKALKRILDGTSIERAERAPTAVEDGAQKFW